MRYSSYLFQCLRSASPPPVLSAHCWDSLAYHQGMAGYSHLEPWQRKTKNELMTNIHQHAPLFTVGDPVWLSVPTAGKLDPKWEGEWVIQSVKSPISMEIKHSRNTTKVVHTNRLQHRNVPSNATSLQSDPHTNVRDQQREPLIIDHAYLHVPPPAAIAPRRYPQRHRAQPDQYGF